MARETTDHYFVGNTWRSTFLAQSSQRAHDGCGAQRNNDYGLRTAQKSGF